MNLLNLPSHLQVLEHLPISCNCWEFLYVFKVPVNSPLGSDEKDYSCVEVQRFTNDGIPAPHPTNEPLNVEYFSVGKLGGLVGGLLNVKDKRKIMSREDVTELAMETTRTKIDAKRTSVGHLTWHQTS